MKILRAEVYADRWNHAAHILDIGSWMLGYERGHMGDHKVWIGPFFLSVFLGYPKSNRGRDNGPQDGNNIDGDQGDTKPPHSL